LTAFILKNNRMARSDAIKQVQRNNTSTNNNTYGADIMAAIAGVHQFS